jgi:hypothetical protein
MKGGRGQTRVMRQIVLHLCGKLLWSHITGLVSYLLTEERFYSEQKAEESKERGATCYVPCNMLHLFDAFRNGGYLHIISIVSFRLTVRR